MSRLQPAERSSRPGRCGAWWCDPTAVATVARASGEWAAPQRGVRRNRVRRRGDASPHKTNITITEN